MGGQISLPSKSNFFELLGYNIINKTAYDLGTVTISLNNITRISYRSVNYFDAIIDLYEVYSYDNLLIVVDSEGLSTIDNNISLSLTKIPSYIIQNNSASIVGGDGNDSIDTSVISKLIEIPNIDLDGTPTTLYACMDVFNKVLLYTDITGYQTTTGIGAAYTYNVSDQVFNSNENACKYVGTTIDVYSSTNPIGYGMVFYTDSALTTPYYSNGYVALNDPNVLSQGNQYSLTTKNDGTINSLVNCSSSPTPTPTVTPTPTPTPTVTP